MAGAGHRGAEAAVRFVIGAGRSGTTLAYKILAMHPETAWISNYVARLPGTPSVGGLNRIYRSFPGLRESAWFGREGTAYTPRHRLLKRLMPVPVEGESVYRRCGIPTFPAADWAISESQKKALRRLFADLQRHQKARVLLTKRTANNRRIPQLAETFPGGRFLHLVRDGRAVAASLLRVHWWHEHEVWWLDRKTPAQWEREGGNPLELAARNWVEEVGVISAGLAAVPAERILEVRYEDLLEKPDEILPSIAGFFGIEHSPDWLTGAAEVPFANPRKSLNREPLETSERELVREIQAPLLRRLGYMT